MATIALSVAGMAIGGSMGGSVLGLSMATIGRATGAAIGRRIDQQLLGAGSDPVETGRIDRFRLTSAGEGTDLQQVYGRMRLPGQVIWATRFRETSTTTGGGGGKGAPRQQQPKTTTYAYSISFAVALCEGEISRVGRIWADDVEVSADDLNMRLYRGTMDQLPDPKIAAVEGIANTPAYRGTAYVVFEDLPLGQFGNRLPQFTFEVARSAIKPETPDEEDLSSIVTGVALIPGTGEYSLATTPVYLLASYGRQTSVNVNTPLGGTDFTVAIDALEQELPACGSVVMVVSWFGNDLRCGACQVQPKVEQRKVDADAMPWRVAGATRSTAELVPSRNGKPIYGGTPADASVVEGIRNLKARGLAPVFYPFILMDQDTDNSLPDPWTGEAGQPALPWRGRITTSLAPGQTGSPDGTATAAQQVAQFMGTAQRSHFALSGEVVNYSGPSAWGYRRFILHYAYLCAAAGGVSAFCIGSEMRALTQIRGADNSFPAVAALRDLAADVRQILGSGCRISYAADWSEYHGYQPAGTGDKFFHLDPLWADPNIDFIGIDNYMPLTDWRDTEDHADAAAGSIYKLEYLQSNIAGGEGYDWYYATPEARAAQRRTPITDGHGEPWVWRYKDLHGWWANPHHNRVAGVRAANSTAWQPQSKPFWFTEFGCAAIDKGANQPNKFLDPKSSESQLPHYSSGNRDDFMQMQYMRAVYRHFADPQNNPTSDLYDGRMLDTARMHVWAWDARPFPFFPANRSFWSDGDNYARGHWLNGRATNRSLASVVAEVCKRSGVTEYDVSELYGVVRGYTVRDIGSARSALQPLMLAYGFEATEVDGVLVFRNRSGQIDHVITDADLAIDLEQDQSMALIRAPAAEIAGRVQIGFLDADGDQSPAVSEAVHPDKVSFGVTRSEMPLALTRDEGNQAVSRWMQEARRGRDTATISLPPSRSDVVAGAVVALQTQTHDGTYRVDRVEEAGLRLVELTRIVAEAYRAQTTQDIPTTMAPFVPPVPVAMVFLDLPLLTGDENPIAPHVAVSGDPFPGTVALYASAQDNGYQLEEVFEQAATIGTTVADFRRGPVGIWDRQSGFEVELITGAISSVTGEAVLSGGNAFAIGDGSADNWEVIQVRESAPSGDGRFILKAILRGQAGSRGLIPDVWPAGSLIVALNGVPAQIQLASSARQTTRHFRYGPAKRPINDPSYSYRTFAFQGNGLRPYPVAHLRALQTTAGLDVKWIRCSRVDGDIWADGDIPLGEDHESYVVRVSQNGGLLRQETLSSPNWQYSAADQTAEVGGAPYLIEVAQLSDRFGHGPFVSLVVGG